MMAALVAAVFPVATTFAAEEVYGGGSVQSYVAEEKLAVGTVVLLTGKNADTVQVASKSDAQNMFGVVVDSNQLPLRLSGASKKNETYVAASGTYNTLVSDQTGAIAAGDYLTLSATEGVLMKAGDEEVTVFGRATTAFTGKDIVLGTNDLKDSDGNTRTVKLGSIPVTIDIKNNPNHKSTQSNLPDFLQRVGQAIAEKEVSPVRIYLSVGITAVTLIAAIAVLYAGIRSGVISIGRNPMSRKSIFKALLQVIITSLLILIVGLLAVYLLLKL